MNADTWSVLSSGLKALFGDNGNAAALIGWASTTDFSTIQQIEDRVPVEVIGLLRRTIANYGPELQRAFDVWNELPDNWHSVSRDVFWDVLRNRARIRIEVEKFNGETLVLDGFADSMLTLTTHLITALLAVGSGEAFSEDRIKRFVDNADDLLKVLRPETSSQPAPDESIVEAAAQPEGPAHHATGRRRNTRDIHGT